MKQWRGGIVVLSMMVLLINSCDSNNKNFQEKNIEQTDKVNYEYWIKFNGRLRYGKIIKKDVHDFDSLFIGNDIFLHKPSLDSAIFNRSTLDSILHVQTTQNELVQIRVIEHIKSSNYLNRELYHLLIYTKPSVGLVYCSDVGVVMLCGDYGYEYKILDLREDNIIDYNLILEDLNNFSEIPGNW